MTATVTAAVLVGVSPETAYREWLEFDAFPHFELEPVSRRSSWDGDEMHWMAEDEPRRARLTQQEQDQRIAWTADASAGGSVRGGVVTFTPTTEQGTEVNVRLEYEPDGIVERLRTAVGTVDQHLQGILERFRVSVETPAGSDLAESDDPIDELSNIAERPGADDDSWRGVGRRSDTGFN